MGIIQKQTLKGTFYAYLGVAVGFLTSGILFPRILSPNEIGLINLLVAFSVIFMQVASLGFNSVIGRLFPYFRDSKKGHNGFLPVALTITFTGLVVALTAFLLMRPIILENNQDKSELLVDYIHYVVPLIIFTLYFNLLDAYNKAIYDAVLGIFLKEFLQRVFIILSLLMYLFEWISIHQFFQFYVISLSLPTIILLFILLKRGEFRLVPVNREIFSKPMLKEILRLCFYGFISGLSLFVVFQIDKILVNRILGLAATGIYATNFFFATLVIIPSRSLQKISITIIADAWKEMNLATIHSVYKKSVVNQGIIGLLIFIGIWANIDNIYRIIPAEYEEGRMVIFFISIANLIQMFSGVVGTIIGTSNYYKALTLFVLVFLVFIVGLCMLFIPMFGITGAAVAIAISTLIFSLMRFLFVQIKYKMNPYNGRTLVLLMIAAVSYFGGSSIPEMDNFLIDILVRSFVIVAIYLPAVYFSGISEEVQTITKNLLQKFMLFFKK